MEEFVEVCNQKGSFNKQVNSQEKCQHIFWYMFVIEIDT